MNLSAKNLSLIGENIISPTKFPVAIIGRGGDKAFFYISCDCMIKDSRDSMDEIPSP